MKLADHMNTKSQVIGPSSDWVKITANFVRTEQLFALQKNGRFFYGERSIPAGSLDVLSLDDTKSRILSGDGDLVMRNRQIADRFLGLPFVDHVLVYKQNDSDYYMVVVSEDRDDVSFHLATVKVDIADVHPDYYFEIRYTTKERLGKHIHIPSEAIAYRRR